MNIAANNPALRSWVNVPESSDFPIQNLPFGIFKSVQMTPRVGVRIGDQVLDMKTLFVLGYLENLPFEHTDFDNQYLNAMMKKGKKAVRDLRNRVSKLMSTEHDDLKKNEHHVQQVLIPIDQVEMCIFNP